jgi:hypothetical protein
MRVCRRGAVPALGSDESCESLGNPGMMRLRFFMGGYTIAAISGVGGACGAGSIAYKWSNAYLLKKLAREHRVLGFFNWF